MSPYLGSICSSPVTNICLNKNGNNVFDPKQTANIFKEFSSKLASNLVSKLPVAPKTFGKTYISSYYEKLNIESDLELQPVDEGKIAEILKKLKPSKAPGIDSITGRFLRDGASVLALPISQLCNLSITSATFPSSCKM